MSNTITRGKAKVGAGTLVVIGSASATWDPASLNDGTGETSSGITVTGAAVGDVVFVRPPYDMQDCVAYGYVQAADTVEIRIQNESGGTRDFAAGAWSVTVVRFA